MAQALGGALAHVAVADHQRPLAGQQHVGAALDGIVQAVAAAVAVVVLRLGDRVVDVDRRGLELAFAQHLKQAVDAGGGFLADAVDGLEHGRIALMHHEREVAAVVEQQVGVPGCAVLEEGLFDAPLVLRLGFALPGEHRDAPGRHRRCRMVLGGEDVARRPTHLGT